MKKNWTKYLSVLLSVVMLMSLLSVGAMAQTGQMTNTNPGGFTPAPNNPTPGTTNPTFPPLYNPEPDDDYEEEDNDKIDIVVRKKWVGDNESIRPSEVLVQLIENGDPIGDPVTIKASKVGDKNWKYTWKNMDDDGEYTIVEINTPEGYTSVVEHVRGNYWTITNTYNPAPAVKNNPETGAGSVGDAGLVLLLCCAACVACANKK